MKKNDSIWKPLLLLVLFMSSFQAVKAESVVYFFVDFRFWNSEYNFQVNGKKAFSLIPEGKPIVEGGAIMYNMVMRKVTFKQSDSYIISVDCPSNHGTYHADLNLHLDDGETYYVVVNATLKSNFLMTTLDEKKGLKLLKKAQKNKKYTINDDYIY